MGALIAFLQLDLGCQYLNKVDVCHQGAPASRGVNRRFDGIQAVASADAAGRLPGGETLVLFASQVEDRSIDEALELRAARLGLDGRPLPGCGSRDGLEDTLAPVTADGPRLQIHQMAALASPANSDPQRHGLVVYAAKRGDEPWTLRGQIIGNAGCVSKSNAETGTPFTLDQASPGALIQIPSIARVSEDSSDADVFLVAWAERLDITTVVKARVVRVTVLGPTFLTPPTVLHLGSGSMKNPHVVRLGPGRAAMVWMEDGTTIGRVAVSFLDARLGPTRPGVWLTDAFATLSPGLGGRKLMAAFDGDNLLVTWVADGAEGRPQLFTRALDLNGQAFAAPVRVGLAPGAGDGFFSASGLAGGGFVVTWREENASAPGTPPTLRLATFDSFGRPAFNNLACAERDVALGRPSLGDDLAQSTVAMGADGHLLVAYTANGPGWDDPSGAGVRSLSLQLATLFPSGRPVVGPTAPASIALEEIGARTVASGPCADPRAGQPGAPCTCDLTCGLGASCGHEQVSGLPGGVCLVDCAMSGPASCGPTSICDDGICVLRCSSAADCPQGQMCLLPPGFCGPFCASDADCTRPRLCDPYRRLCTPPVTGGGLFAECASRDDCRSRRCGSAIATRNRCITSCRVGVSLCPEGGICVLDGAGPDSGLCFPPCVQSGCTDPGLVCRLVGAHPTPVCAVPR